MRFLNRQKFFFLTIVITGLVLVFFYHNVLFAPNDFLFGGGGDGIKNYYALMFHAKYDSGFTEFTGMNYPYFEHIVYTDAHPLLSYFIGIFGLEAYGIGILNLMMLMSYPIGAAFIFKIFRHYQVAVWWAIAASIAIIFLSPQVYRMTGHYSLSYVFAVPIMWWLLIKSYNTQRAIWSWMIVLYLLIFFFTHPYLGLILTSFVLAFWGLNAVLNNDRRKKSLTRILIQAILPIVIFQGIVFLTDTHQNRLSNPAGFFNYYASWKSLTIPHDGPLSHIAKTLQINIGNWESWAYIGFPTIVFTIIIGFYLFKTKKLVNYKTLKNKEVVLFFLASYFILLFSFCFPLKYDWMRWVTDLFGPLKQFRVLGRFTWIFFYVITILSIVGIYRLRSGRTWIDWLFIGGVMLYCFEFYPVHYNTANDISSSKNTFKLEHVSPELKEVIDQVKKQSYDALIILPFQHMSSENIMLLGDEEANNAGFLLSYHTGIPLMNSVTSRMSLTEAIAYNNYFSPGFVEKALTYDLPENAKIGIIKKNGVLEPGELRMIWQSEQIFENSEYLIFNFDQSAWNNPSAFNKVKGKNKIANQELADGWRSDTNDVWFYYESFDSCTTIGKDLKPLAGEGSLYGEKSGWNTAIKLEKKEINPGNYIVSFWYDLRVDRPDVLAVVQENQAAAAVWQNQFLISQSTHIVNEWCFVEMEFELSEKFESLEILLTGNGNREPFHIDELLIRPAQTNDLFRDEEINGVAYLVYNNYWLSTEQFKRK